MCPAFQAELQIIFAGDECRRPRPRQSVKIVCLTIDDLMPLFLLLPVMDLFFLLSLFLALFIFLLKLLMWKRLNSMQQTAQNPMGAKNAQKKTRTLTHCFFRKKHWVKCGYVSKSWNAADPMPTKTQQKHGLWPIVFFEKNNGSNVAMLVRAATLQTHRPQKRNKNTDFEPLFFSTKRVTCALLPRIIYLQRPQPRHHTYLPSRPTCHPPTWRWPARTQAGPGRIRAPDPKAP